MSEQGKPPAPAPAPAHASAQAPPPQSPPPAGGDRPPLPGGAPGKPPGGGPPPPAKSPAKTIKRDTLFFSAFACLVIGFVTGVIFSIYKIPELSGLPSAPGPGPGMGEVHNGLSPEEDRVMASLEQAVAADPANLQAWTQLGHLYFDTDQYRKAIAAYKRSLELEPENADVVTDLGVMYRRNGQPKAAVEAFERAIALNPRHETARFNKGVVLLHDFNNREGAMAVWRELLELNPVAYAPNGQLVRELLEELALKP